MFARMEAASTPRVLHLALVVGGELVDPDGAKLGRVDDLIVRLGDDEYPPVTGLLATVAGRQVFVPADAIAGMEQGGTRLRPARPPPARGRQVFAPADAIAEMEHGRTRLRTRRLDLQPFERRPQEVLLKK